MLAQLTAASCRRRRLTQRSGAHTPIYVYRDKKKLTAPPIPRALSRDASLARPCDGEMAAALAGSADCVASFTGDATPRDCQRAPTSLTGCRDYLLLECLRSLRNLRTAPLVARGTWFDRTPFAAEPTTSGRTAKGFQWTGTRSAGGSRQALKSHRATACLAPPRRYAT